MIFPGFYFHNQVVNCSRIKAYSLFLDPLQRHFVNVFISHQRFYIFKCAGNLSYLLTCATSKTQKIITKGFTPHILGSSLIRLNSLLISFSSLIGNYLLFSFIPLWTSYSQDPTNSFHLTFKQLKRSVSFAKVTRSDGFQIIPRFKCFKSYFLQKYFIQYFVCINTYSITENDNHFSDQIWILSSSQLSILSI